MILTHWGNRYAKFTELDRFGLRILLCYPPAVAELGPNQYQQTAKSINSISSKKRLRYIGGCLDVPVPERNDLVKTKGFFSKGKRPLCTMCSCSREACVSKERHCFSKLVGKCSHRNHAHVQARLKRLRGPRQLAVAVSALL